MGSAWIMVDGGCDLIHCAVPGWSEGEDKLVLDRLGEEGRKRRCGE